MKRNLNKRTRIATSRHKDFKKPFGFCCDINHQDPETEYDMRIPPFESVFPETQWDIMGPEIKFRLQDIGKVPPPLPRIGIYREDTDIKKAATYGRSKKGRGPLLWFVEDEIEMARDLIAREKKSRREMKQKEATKKVNTKDHKKTRKSTKEIDEGEKHEDESKV